jgi:Bifunctional DNA primase/polymerase, N-terminal
MFIRKETPLPKGAEPSPLMAAALALARDGWPIVPVRPFWLEPHIQRPCSENEPLCLATGWHALTLESILDRTRNEATIREWWTKWPDAYICCLAAMTPDLKTRPWAGKTRRLAKDELFGIIVYGYRDGKIRLCHAGAVIWGERASAHPLVRDFLAEARHRDKRAGRRVG